MYQWNWYFKPYFEFVHQFLRALAGSECRETLNKFVFSVFLKPECSALKQTWTPTESVYWSVWMQSLCTSGKLCRESSISICRHSELTCCSLARNACFGFHSFDVTFAAMLHLNVALPSGKRKVLEVAESSKVGDLKFLAQQQFQQGFLRLITAEGHVLSDLEESLHTASGTCRADYFLNLFQWSIHVNPPFL